MHHDSFITLEIFTHSSAKNNVLQIILRTKHLADVQPRFLSIPPRNETPFSRKRTSDKPTQLRITHSALLSFQYNRKDSDVVAPGSSTAASQSQRLQFERSWSSGRERSSATGQVDEQESTGPENADIDDLAVQPRLQTFAARKTTHDARHAARDSQARDGERDTF